jgi:DNA-binding Lrp family transcriptional regulator
MIAGTVKNEEAILNAVEEDGTRSIGEIARPLGICSSTV